jgi:serine/threonine protein kinase
VETEVSLDENKTEFTVFNDSGDTIFEWSDDDSENLQDELVLKAEEVVSKHLEIDSVFNNKYKIKKILGQGGLGITYLAVEDISNKKVVIKEFFPKGYVSRAKDGSVILGNKISKENYNTLLKTFEQEAQNLVKVTVDKHPNIVNFLSFEENINNTKYFLMDFEEGEDLSEYIKKEDVTLTEKEISSIINPILDGLSHIHKLDVYHKDIKPDNIFLRKNADPMLIDFGASVSSVLYLTPAYAPIEQVKQDIDIKQGNLSPQKAQFGVIKDFLLLYEPPLISCL